VFLSELVDNAYIFFLLFARVFAILSIAPLLSSSAFPPLARIALSLFTAILLLPSFIGSAYPPPGTG
jgi:flagellar biosynthetic protein FliR